MKAFYGLILLTGLSPQVAAAAEPSWYVVLVRGTPALCGEARDGQFLCLGAPDEAPATKKSPVSRARFRAADWNFLQSIGPT